MLKVGAIGFGGGSALIPVMERELVTPHGGLDQHTFVQDTVIANITPGALPVKLAALSGIQLGGPALAVFSGLAVALPGAALTVSLLAVFAAVGSAGHPPGRVRLARHHRLHPLPARRVRREGDAVVGPSVGAVHRHRTRRVPADRRRTDRRTRPGSPGPRRGSPVPEMSALGLVCLALAGIGVLSFVQWARRRGAAAPPTLSRRPGVAGRWRP